MGYGIKILAKGPRACFTRPEMKSERVSYDCITPSAARGLIESVYWKPAIRWHIDRIHVLNEIRFDTFRRNELGGKMPYQNAKKAMEKDAPAASRSRASRTSGAERRARGCVQRSASTILAMSRPMHMANKSRVSGRPSVSQNGIRSEGIMRVGYHAFRGEASVYSSVSRHCVKAGIRVD